MRMKFSEIVQKVISLAGAANKARLADNRADDSPIVASGYVSTARPQTTTKERAEERRLREFLEAQSPSAVYMLTAIMYLGRGDFTAKDLSNQYADIRDTFGEPRWAVRQMLEKWPLPEYLEEGLKKLAHAQVDADELLPG